MAESDSGSLLELYKTAVEMADRVSARRAGANSFFVTINTTLTAILGVLTAARKVSSHKSSASFDAFGLCVTAAAGVVLALVWWALLRYYRRLNKAKWDVINRLETQLPASPFTDEWRLLHPEESPSREAARGWSVSKRLRIRVKHREATVVEQFVPFVFVVLYIIAGIRAVTQ